MSPSAMSPPLSPIAPASNRRLSTRVAAILPVELVFADGGILPARTADVGMGGTCVATACMIDPELVRSVRLTLDREPFDLAVTSRWKSKQNSTSELLTGFLFDSTDNSVEAALWSFIQQRGRELALYLRSCEGLDHLGFQESFELALATRLRVVEASELVYGEASQSASKSIFALFRGAVILERAGAGSERMLISSVRPGELFGGLPVIAGCTPFERAVAVEASTVLEFVGYNIEYLLSAKPPIGIALLRVATFHWMRRFSQALDDASGRQC